MAVLRNTKIDITEKVTGKIKNGQIELFLEHEPIGRVKFPNSNVLFELEHHFEQSGSKIFQHITSVDQPNARYTDCDEGGWC